MSGVSLADGAESGAPYRGRLPERRGLLGTSRAGYLLGSLGLVAAYYGAAHIGYAFQFAGPVASIVWLPAGVGIAFLYLAGLRFWPGIVIGDLLVNNYSALPVGSAVGQTVGNLLEILVAVALLRRLSPRGSPLATPSGVAVVVGAIAAGAAVSATCGVVSLRLGGVIGSSLADVWRTWWLGDFCGALIVVPLTIAWRAGTVRAWLRGRGPEATLALLAVSGTSLLAMGSDRPITYIVFPALLWATLRFGQRGATLSILIVSGVAVWATTHYYGPFVFHSIPRSVLSTQLFIAVASISTLTLAAVVSEREFLSRRLGASRARLGAADSERRRLERDLHDGAQQRLVALAAHLGLSAIEADAEPARAGALFESAQAELQVAIDELRTLAHGLHPSLLTRLGLAAAIQAVADSSPIPVSVVDPPEVRLDQGVEATAYFVAVEAIVNAQKHSQASAIQVRFDMGSDWLKIEIADDGIGGAVEHPRLGLEGLRDRVEGLGGTLEVDSPPGRGTRVAAAIPTGGVIAAN